MKRIIGLFRKNTLMRAACIGFALVLAAGLIFAALLQVFENITLMSITRLNSQFSAQVDSVSAFLQFSIKSFGMPLFYSPAVTKLRENESLTNYERILGVRELGVFVSTSEFADSVYIFSGKQGMAHTTDSSQTSETFARFHDQEAVRLFLNRKNDDRLLPILRDAPGKNKRYYSFIMFELTMDNKPDDSAIMINVSSEWFDSMLLRLDSPVSGGASVIVDPSGVPIISSRVGYGDSVPLFYEDISPKITSGVNSGYLIRPVQGQRVVCFYSSMSTNKWCYLQFLPYEECMPGLNQLRTGAFSVFGGLLGLLTVFAMAVLLKVYLPYRGMRLSLSRFQETVPELANGTAPLSDQMDYLVDRSIDSIRKQPLYDRLLREKAIYALLEGRNWGSSEGGSDCLLPDDGQPITLILACRPETDQILKVAKQWQAEAEGAVSNGITAMLIRMKEGESPEPVCQQIAAQFGCRCIYSRPVKDPSLLPACYERLLEVESLHCLYEGRKVLSEAQLDGRNEPSGLNEPALKQMLRDINAGSLDKAISCWHEVLCSIMNDRYREMVFSLRRVENLLLARLGELEENSEHCVPHRQMVERLHDAQSIDEISDYMETLLLKISQRIASDRRQKARQVVSQIDTIIHQQWADPGLNAQSIADAVGFSSAYVANLFRQEKGLSISEQINVTRIRHAQVLLCQPGPPVQDIAKQVGFENTKYFFVLFKQYTGITPLRYREQSCSDT